MKTTLLLKKIALITLISFGSQKIFSQQISIPDSNFEQFLIDENYDTVLDGFAEKTIIENISFLSPSNKGINDLTGIEYFTSLISLNAQNNNISNIDISNLSNLKSLYLSNNNLDFINLSNCTLLENVTLGNNNISNLSLSNNNNIKSLDVINNRLSELYISNLTSLVSLNVANNFIEDINFFNNLNLERFWGYNNEFTTLDFSLHSSLIFLNLQGCELNYLNISNGNNINLYYLDSRGNDNLNCIIVDDASYDGGTNAGGFPQWFKSNSTSLTENSTCSTLSIVDTKKDYSIIQNHLQVIFKVASFKVAYLYNMQGQKVLTTKDSFINKNEISRGIYILRLMANESEYLEKIYIKN